jgi:glycosyltransferase involved in cell wall biosynthesis
MLKLLKHEPKRILFFVSDDWYFCSHRLPIAVAAQDEGFEVFVVCNVNKHAEQIKNFGFNLIPITLVRNSINLLQLFIILLNLIIIIRRVKPSIIHNVSAKPIILGTIASLFLRGAQVVNQLPGLGVLAYSRFSGLKKCMSFLLFTFFQKILVRIKCWVILQNADDFERMASAFKGSKSKVLQIKGSGVDSKTFLPTPFSVNPKRVALVARMIEPKGINDFVAAAKIIWAIDQTHRFILVGDTDRDNSTGISSDVLLEYSKQPNIEWWGHVNDIKKVWDKCCIACLPSKYPEGIPMSLLEAASCGRPLVGSDVPGCIEIVKDGVNGIVVPTNAPKALATALLYLLDNDDVCEIYGARSRQLVIDKFDKLIVQSETIALYKEVYQASN